MSTIGIFFGTDSGSTRLVAKKIAKQLKKRLGEGAVAKPLNVNRASPDDLLGYPCLILGTPTYGDGLLPGKAADLDEESWAEFLPALEGRDLTGVTIALYGLGDQETYPKDFVDGMKHLYDFFSAAGARLVGGCGTDGYEFQSSKAVLDGRFVGLALDQHLQHLLTDERIAAWLDEILPELHLALEPDAVVAAGGS
jgi:flavodoxin I